MKRSKFIAVAVIAALAVAACGSSKKAAPATTAAPSTTAAPAKKGGTLVFGASADPVVLDGAFVSDGESLRVIDQIFETLVTTKPAGTDIIPLLADSWSASADGKSWTFNLHKGVMFHDGTAFNAAAVCFNFDRWYHFTGVAKSSAVSYYWGTVFGGYADDKSSLYKSCEAKDDNTAIINLTEPSAAFLSGLAISAFSIASPDALKKYEADKVGGTQDAPTFDGTFGKSHPVGTGPFMFESWTPGDKLVIARNDNYWGTKANLDKVIFKAIADGPARRQALESGEIQGYDLVDPADVDALKASGIQILLRPAFNVGYVGFNQAMPPLDNLKVRQAIAYALDRDALVKAKYPAGAQVATQFQPPSLFGWSPDVTVYTHDVAKAKQLLKDSGVTNPTLEFWYPSDISRPYMPDPTGNFSAFKANLEEVGFKIVPKTAPWRSGYLDAVDAGKAQMYLLGWTGDFGDPDNFVGTFFRTKQPSWGFDNQAIFDGLTAARNEPDASKRAADYQAMNKTIMDFLPGVPYVHTQPALAFAKNVTGYVPSPVSLEPFSTVSIG